jgi:hypothetical protein
MAAGYALIMLIPPLRDFFELYPPPAWAWTPMAVAAAAGAAGVLLLPRLVAAGAERRSGSAVPD